MHALSTHIWRVLGRRRRVHPNRDGSDDHEEVEHEGVVLHVREGDGHLSLRDGIAEISPLPRPDTTLRQLVANL